MILTIHGELVNRYIFNTDQSNLCYGPPESTCYDEAVFIFLKLAFIPGFHVINKLKSM